MGATKDENKDLTDFSLRLSASARDMFFLPQRRRGAGAQRVFIFSYKVKGLRQAINNNNHLRNALSVTPSSLHTALPVSLFRLLNSVS
ncbi:MAG: hypothetical protein Q7U02_10715 [Desulfosalsimonadaceae bacterium]|nr:hypothetical protein [Desulfosalsimonadaceae bacterium]